jgi:hypothetical protein
VGSHIVDISEAGAVGSELMQNGMRLNGNFIIGEWSCALTDDSLSGEPDPVSARRQFCEIQEQTYRDVSAGSAFWSECDLFQRCSLPPPILFTNEYKVLIRKTVIKILVGVSRVPGVAPFQVPFFPLRASPYRGV